MINVNDDLDAVFIVQRGLLEAYTYFEGNEFVLERLPKGSVINMQALSGFEDDASEIYVRAVEPSIILGVSDELVSQACELDEKISKEFKLRQHKTISSDNFKPKAMDFYFTSKPDFNFTRA